FLAWLVDAALLLMLGFVGLMLAQNLEILRAGVGLAVMVLWIFMLNWGYYLCFEWLWNGQTPGKRMAGIRVLDVQGGGMSAYQTAVRNVVRWVDALPVVTLSILLASGYGFAFVIAAANDKQRRLGDWAAGTLVVHVERRPRLIRALQGGADAMPVSEPLVRQR